MLCVQHLCAAADAAVLVLYMSLCSPHGSASTAGLSQSWWRGDLFFWQSYWIIMGMNNPMNHGYVILWWSYHETHQVSYIIQIITRSLVNFLEARPGSTKKLQTEHRPPCFQRRDRNHLQHGLHQTVVFDLRGAKESAFELVVFRVIFCIEF